MSANEQRPSDQRPSGQRGNKWWTLVAVCLGTFMLLLDITIVNVALPDIQRALHSSFSDLQWVVDAYALTLAAFLLTAGSLADMYGRRLLYLVGLVVFTAASALCGFAQTTLMLQLSRALQGVGGAIMFAVSLALLADAFRGKDRGTAFGIWGGVTGVAVAIGPLAGGVLTTGLSWRWIFFVNVPFGIAAVVIAVLRVSESRAPQASGPDWLGFALFTVALASLVYGLIESNQRSFTDQLVLACFAVAAALLVAFVITEMRTSHPMFDLSLFRLPTFTGGSVAAFGVSASIFSVLLYLVLYFQDILGLFGPGNRCPGHGAVRRDPGDRDPGGPAVLEGAGPAAHRTRPHPLRRGAAAHARAQRRLGLDPSHPGHDRGRPGRRPGEPAARLHRRRRRSPAACRDGVGYQLHLPSGGHRDRDRPARDAVLQPGQGRGAIRGRRRAGAGARGTADRHGRSVRPGRDADPEASRPARRQTVATITRTAFTTGLNHILLVAAIIAFVSGVVSLLAIRSKDFAAQTEGDRPASADVAAQH